MYAILTADQITATGTADNLWPGVTMPSTGPRADWLAEQNAVEIRHDPPHDPATQYLRRCEPYLLEGEVFDREVITRPPVKPAPPEPRWVEFGDAVIDHPGVAAVVDGAPRRLAIALGVGLGQAAQGDAKTFAMAWVKALAAGLVTPELAAEVQTLAESFDLPEAFVAGLNPEPQP
jgi:hypothetical protein